ncbi:MAG: alanine--tRNA ligase [Gammaproteobacteria bacterium]|nr:alanine--tRNA ligase [Gammaproteobacteria bacterium]
MDSSAIRQAFLNYFASLGHQVVPSSSLLPANDPTLLFTNAGMNQFKDVFLGSEQRSYQRAVSVQRCVRAGGKHNDLENVGFTARHHTFFEMLGNFSFGDYFKRDAIEMAWAFLTKVLGIPPEKLWVTVFESDDESADIWIKEIGVSPDRLTRMGAADNFWSMGDTGPCGPCSEIYYDHGPSIAGGPPGSPDMEGDRFVEIWNIVFMQYNRDPSGQMHPLPKPSVDTGMGLERIAAVMQGVNSNYETDIFLRLRTAILALQSTIDVTSPSVNVIADHVRSCAFLIADGILPSNEGRGYVLRRIIRRAIRHGHRLGLPHPFMHQLLTPLIEMMGKAYPQLEQQQAVIEALLKQEEEQFIRTLNQGLKLLQDSLAQCQHRILAGDVAFKLYDTYGFPVDLTNDVAREVGIEIDMQGFEQAMQQQRQQSQAQHQFQADYLELPLDIQATHFHGYQHLSHPGIIMTLYKDGQKVNILEAGDQGAVILSETPFYAESGGQIGDTGYLKADGLCFEVTDTQKKGELILHLGRVLSGRLELSMSINASVDEERRQAIRLNHTATHILHAALREILGNSVQQRGSLVNDHRSRFDFSFNRSLSAEEILEVESWVNAKIRANVVVSTELLGLEQAQARGAMALFGEKYADEVRVLSLGDFSQELCGGTHAQRSGDIGLLKILSEASIASGVRRIEFVTGKTALLEIQACQRNVQEIANTLKTSPELALERVKASLEHTATLQQELQKLQKQSMLTEAKAWIKQQEAKGRCYLIQRDDRFDAKSMRGLMDVLKDLKKDWMFVIYSVIDKHLTVMVTVPKNLLDIAPNAQELIKQLCERGGGRPDFAQGGGMVPMDLDEKINGIEEKLNAILA